MTEKMLSYTIQPGETLWTVAEKLLGQGARYRDFMQWNAFITDPNRIEVGWTIQYPLSQATTSTYGPGVSVTTAPDSSSQQTVVAPSIPDVPPIKLPSGGMMDVIKNPVNIAMILMVIGAAVVLGKRKPKRA